MQGQQEMEFCADTAPRPPQSPVESLDALDWDFPDRVAHSDIEGIHPYPAKFVAELPRALLGALPRQKGTAVLDLFCGSGTTLVECQRRGVPAIGIDLNPIACLMSRVKTTACPTALKLHGTRVVHDAKAKPAPRIPAIPNLDHWFAPGVQAELAGLTESIDCAPVEARDCLRLALSSIIVRVSNQESDTRYAAVAKGTAPHEVPTLFLRAVQRIESALTARRYQLTPVEVIQGDTLKIGPERIGRAIGLVVTSPPYPNAYEYWLYHKYRMWWLGFDPLSVKAAEIGARAHFFKKDHHTAEDFRRQMGQALALLGQTVVSSGYVCFVVGRSRIHGEIVDNAEIVETVGRDYGFRRYFAKERALPAGRKSFNLSHANIKTETVLVLRKEAT